MQHFQPSITPVEGLMVSSKGGGGASVAEWIDKWTFTKIKADSCSTEMKRTLLGHQEAA